MAVAVTEPWELVAVNSYVVVVVGVTDRVPVEATSPIPGVMDTDVAFATVQFSVEDDPEATVTGEAENELIVGDPSAATVTVAVFVAGPTALVAVSV